MLEKNNQRCHSYFPRCRPSRSLFPLNWLRNDRLSVIRNAAPATQMRAHSKFYITSGVSTAIEAFFACCFCVYRRWR